MVDRDAENTTQRTNSKKAHLKGVYAGMSKRWSLAICAKAESNKPSETPCGRLADDSHCRSLVARLADPCRLSGRL
jgi:hypothetical protein